MLIYGTAKQKKPSMITGIAIKMDLLLYVCVSWNGEALWKIQDESIVTLDKQGLQSLLSNITVPPRAESLNNLEWIFWINAMNYLLTV